MSLLAVDMGSSSCKAVVFSEDGRLLAQSTYPYSAHSPRPGYAEMPPDKFWDALRDVICRASADAKEKVAALAISSHGETFIPVNAQQRPVGNAILNIDNRATHETKEVAEMLGRKRIFEITGLAAHTMYPIPKILWLRKHESQAFSSTARFLPLTSYLLIRLGLPAYVDFSLASRFLAFDVRKQRWSEEILSAFGLKADQFADAVPSGAVAGRLSATVASDLGLPAGTLVAVGGHDQPCAALGCGVLEPGRVSASFGTYECLVAASALPAINDNALSANLNSYCHVVPERFVTLAYFPAGIMLEWLIHLLYPGSAASLSDLCSSLEAAVREGPTGLCVTPHLMGTCNPDFDPHATGVILGLLPVSDRHDLYKAILEGIACEFAAAADLLELAVGPFQDVYVAGGGGRSPLGLRLRAGLSGRRLHRMQASEAVCLGTAILAGIAAGVYSDFHQAVRQLVVATEIIHPSSDIAAQYHAQLDTYRLLYSSLAPVRTATAGLRSRGEIS